LREELIRFVTVESSKVRIGERLPGTTEVLESCFGCQKSGVSSSFLPEKMNRHRITRKDELTSRQEARERRIVTTVKPFAGTLRVTNPARKSRASSRKRVLHDGGQPPL